MNKVSVSINMPMGTYNDCLWRGDAILTNPSGRVLVLEGATYAYHMADIIGFTLYLERRDPKTHIITTAATYSKSKNNDSYVCK